jgi:hypothetical protein
MLAVLATCAVAVPAPTAYPFECKLGFDCLKTPRQVAGPIPPLTPPPPRSANAPRTHHNSPPPPVRSVMCKSDADCETGLTCVIESASYSQCVDCTPATFAKQCIYASETFLPKAMDKCGIEHCGTRCPHHVDADCVAPLRCAVQADGYYGECVDCDAKSFSKECAHWSPKIVDAAEKMCDEKCDTVEEGGKGGECCGASCSSDSDCAPGLFCCPNHNECMDTATKSTAGPACDACQGGYSTYSTYASYSDSGAEAHGGLLGRQAHGQAPKRCDDA